MPQVRRPKPARKTLAQILHFPTLERVDALRDEMLQIVRAPLDELRPEDEARISLALRAVQLAEQSVRLRARHARPSCDVIHVDFRARRRAS